MIDLFIPGTPKGQPRPRAFSAGGKARVYTPGTAENWKSEIAAAVKPYLPAKPLGGPLRVEVLFFMPRPKAHYGTGKRAEILKDSAPTFHTARPDIDNMAKAVLDALTTIGLFRDDAQICAGRFGKTYANNGRPGCSLQVEEIEE